MRKEWNSEELAISEESNDFEWGTCNFNIKILKDLENED